MYHDVLARQLRKLGCDPEAPPTVATWRRLLDDLSSQYEENERARYLLQRSVTMASRAMQELDLRMAAERVRFAHLFRHSPFGVARVEIGGAICEVNPQFARILGQSAAALLGQDALSLIVPDRREHVAQLFNELRQGTRTEVTVEESLLGAAGRTIVTKFSASTVSNDHDKPAQLILVIEDISTWAQMQAEVQQTEKLQSVGRLAAGIAHEINTPMQYVGTNVTFLESAFADLLALCEEYRQACAKAETARLTADEVAQLRAAEETADLSYLRENVPRALMSSGDGIKRVGAIVHSMQGMARSMKGPRQLDGGEPAPADLNGALQSSLTLVSGYLRPVAEVETEYAELPAFSCFVDDLNQAFMSLLTNAGQAVEAVVGSTGVKGFVRIKTAVIDDHIVISISDSGTGIAPEIRGRIFDPFFTTKPVGKGSGQGLTLARSVIVEKHGGRISFESEVGRGTSFHLHLPLLRNTARPISSVDAA